MWGPQGRALAARGSAAERCAMAEPGQNFRKLRRTAGMRNVVVGSAAAFAGGALVVGLQALVAMAGARYPPIVQGLHCNFTKQAAGAAPRSVAEIGEGGGDLTPPAADDADPDAPASAHARLIPTVTAGDAVTCFLDAPGADYAAWAVAGRVLQYRSGPLDPALPCQDAQAFAAQSPDDLRLSTCQSFRLTEPGEYRLVMKVMARGSTSVDREQLHFLVQPAPAPSAQAAEAPLATRLKTTLLLPGRDVTQSHSIPISESLSEHGLLPTSRDYSAVVYHLAAGEAYISSKFNANSASQASNTRVAYQPKSRNVTMSFTLRSGPLIDQWRGWISGSVVVRVKREDPARSVDLPDIDLQLPGESTLPLPESITSDRLNGAKLRLVRSETNTLVDAALGQTVALDDALITPTLANNAIVIEAQRRSVVGGTK